MSVRYLLSEYLKYVVSNTWAGGTNWERRVSAGGPGWLARVAKIPWRYRDVGVERRIDGPESNPH